MIEPQNNLMPLASEPRPADAPPGESVGFGEMLAQSLGMIAQVDPNAIQQIDTGAKGQDQSAAGDAESPPSETDVAPAAGRVIPPAAATRPMAAAAPQVRPQSSTSADAVAPELRPTISPLPSANGDAPIDARTIAAPANIASIPIEPANPVGVSAMPDVPATPVAQPSVEPVTARTAPTPIPHLLETEESPVDTAVPRGQVGTDTGPVVDTGLEPILSVSAEAEDPVVAAIQQEPNATPVAGDREVVTTAETARSAVRPEPSQKPRPAPAVSTPAAPDRPVVSHEAAAAAIPDPRPVTAPGPQRVTMNPEPAVRIDAPAPIVSPAQTGGTSDVPMARTADFKPAVDASTPIVGAPAGEGFSVSVPNPLGSAEANQVQASALAERVMQAVDLQRTQPPPRSMVVDIPEVEGLRLVVSIRAGGQVSVTPAPGWANADAYAPFADDVARVLSERGFVMTGDGRQRGHNPFAAEEQPPPRAARQPFRRQGPTDNDLRI